jgi:hypothetical protein
LSELLGTGTDDCDDTNATINPATVWYIDSDSDGYGTSRTQCNNPGAGYTTTVLPLGDCDDTLASINPGVTEILTNGIDDDCNWDTSDYTVNTFYAELGGYVIEVSEGGLHGLVVAMRDQGRVSWYFTANILNDTANHDTDGAKFNDWRLPNKRELSLMYLQRISIGGFVPTYYASYYWSSTQYDANFAWRQSFSPGFQDYYYKSLTDYVRAVRAF